MLKAVGQDNAAEILISLKTNHNTKLPSVKELLNYHDYREFDNLLCYQFLSFLPGNLSSIYADKQPIQNVDQRYIESTSIELNHSLLAIRPPHARTGHFAHSLKTDTIGVQIPILSITNHDESKKRKRTTSESTCHHSNVESLSPTSSSPDVDSNIPRRQPLKFPEDLYTPRWIRHHGAKREGLCELCEGGKWLQLKDSAYWYHKQFVHGISSASGLSFPSPLEYRSVWNGTGSEECGFTISIVTEGLCQNCSDWIPLFKNKKRFSAFYPNFDSLRDEILENCPELKSLPELISLNPLKILVGRQMNNQPYLPKTLPISKSVIRDMQASEEGELTGVWWKHCHSCVPM